MAAKAGRLPGQAEGHRRGLAVLLLAILCALCAPFFVDTLDHRAPQPRDGVVSYAGWGPLKAPVELGGTWRVVWRTAPAPGRELVLPVPGAWRDAKVDGRRLPEGGAASYLLTVRDLPAGRYTLWVGKGWSGSRVWVNGRLVSQQGDFGLTPQTSRYVGRAHEVALETDGRDLQLQVDISTFHHRDNGLGDAPVLGPAQPMTDWILLGWMRSLLLLASLFLMACLAAAIFIFRREDRASLYLAVACVMLLPLAAMLTQDNVLTLAVPDLPFAPTMVLQFLTSTIALGAVLAYTHELFPRESPRPAYLALQALNAVRFVAYAAVGATGDIVRLSHYSQAAVAFRTLTLLYILGVVVAACVRRREGALLFLTGMGAVVASIVYTDLVNNAGFPRVFGLTLLPIGMLVLLFSQLILLAERWSTAIRTEAQTNADLRRLLDVNISISSEMELEALLRKIVGVTSKVIQADRSSLFLHDPATGELWSAVAEGAGRELRFPSDRGLAGWSFTHGETLSLTDAYGDSRFNAQVDAETGYRTRSVLTAPVTGHDGRRLGVMQALNRQGSRTFGPSDLERLSAFAAQAAVAIENAVLFSEVAAERTYNESILRSMSAGVVTLDGERRFARLNPAAARILEAASEALDGAALEAWLRAGNPALLAEIEAVARSGRPKSLPDYAVKTAKGHAVSANLSLAPLVGEREPPGLLMLVEDITEGKRLQAAMRRFMTQEVVDQVMGREDDLLFGESCRASILFADLRNFTALAEQLEARQTVDMLNEVFTELFEAVAAANGVLDKFIGDALMAVYGAPIPSGRDQQNAVQSALAMGRLIDKLNTARRARGQADLRLGVSIATGDVIAGAIGSPKRMDYTVIGDSVNLAARLQQTAKVYEVGIVCDEATAAAVAGDQVLRELDTIRVRGRTRPERIFQVLTDAAACPGLDAYRRGRAALEARQWTAAVAAFAEAAAADPDDRPAGLMLERARALAADPPGEGWDGVWAAADAA